MQRNIGTLVKFSLVLSILLYQLVIVVDEGGSGKMWWHIVTVENKTKSTTPIGQAPIRSNTI